LVGGIISAFVGGSFLAAVLMSMKDSKLFKELINRAHNKLTIWWSGGRQQIRDD
jgi:hypothetical protein